MYVNTQSSHGSVMGLSNMLVPNGWSFTNFSPTSRAFGGNWRNTTRGSFCDNTLKIKGFGTQSSEKMMCFVHFEVIFRWSIREFFRGFPMFSCHMCYPQEVRPKKGSWSIPSGSRNFSIQEMHFSKTIVFFWYFWDMFVKFQWGVLDDLNTGRYMFRHGIHGGCSHVVVTFRGIL